MHVVSDVERRVRAFRSEQVAPLVGDGLWHFTKLDVGFEIGGMRPDKDLQHAKKRIALAGLFFVPESGSRVHHHEMVFVDQQFTDRVVVMTHDATRHPGDDLVIGMGVKANPGAGFKHGVDDQGQRAIPMIDCAGHIITGQIHMQGKGPLMLYDVRFGGFENFRGRLNGARLVKHDVTFHLEWREWSAKPALRLFRIIACLP